MRKLGMMAALAMAALGGIGHISSGEPISDGPRPAKKVKPKYVRKKSGKVKRISAHAQKMRELRERAASE